MRLALIGAGKMGTALAQGLADKGVLAPDDMVAADISAAAREAFARATGVRCRSDPAAAAGAAETVLLAVKPQVAAEAAAGIADACRGKLVVSIAAGVQIRTLGSWFESDRIVRVMPNTPLTVGAGATVFASAAGTSAADREFVRSVFSALGVVYELPEERIDAVTALSGSGPAYVFEFIQALADAGAAAGLDPEVAMELTVQTVFGAARMLQSGLGSPVELRIAVTSPGGTTAAGLAVMEEAGFRALLCDVVAAAKARSEELGRGQ